MPRFFTKAKTSPGEIKTGVHEASTVEEAVQKMLALGQVPLEVKPYKEAAESGEASPRNGSGARGPKVRLKALAGWTRQLYDLVDAGVPILRSLEILGRSCADVALQEVVMDMRLGLIEGESLAVAMARYPSVFPAFYMHTVRSGEASGHLPEVLSRLAAALDKDEQLRSKVAGSLMYPAIVFGVGILTFVVILTVVMPQLSALFEDFDTALPVPTQIVMAASDFMAVHWWWVVLLLGAAGLAAGRVLATPSGRKAFDGAVLRVPVLGGFIRQAEMTRVARTLGTLLEGGVPVAQAIQAVAEIADNMVIRQELKSVARDVQGGDSLTQALKKAADYWSEAAVSMIAVGEESGHLEKGLYKLAAALERETEEAAGVFVTVLGPLVLLLVVGVIGGMVISMLLPLFQMNSIMK